MPEIRPEEFYTDDVILPRSIQHLWLVDTGTVKIQNLAATNEGPLIQLRHHNRIFRAESLAWEEIFSLRSKFPYPTYLGPSEEKKKKKKSKFGLT